MFRSYSCNKAYEDYTSWRQSTSHLAIGKEGNFDRYFTFSLNNAAIAESDVENVIKSEDKEFVLGQFKAWDADNNLSLWIERIYASVWNTKTLCSNTFLSTWLEVGDVPLSRPFFRYQDFLSPSSLLLFKALFNKQSIGRQDVTYPVDFLTSRVEVSTDFLEIIQKTQGVHLPIRSIDTSIRLIRELQTIMGDQPLVSQIVIDQCREICSERVARLAQQRELIDHPYVDYLVQFWLQSDAAAARQWLNSIQSDETKLFKIMDAWLSAYQSRAANNYRIDLAELLLNMVPLVKITELVNTYVADGIDDNNASVVRFMRDLLPGFIEYDTKVREQGSAGDRIASE